MSDAAVVSPTSVDRKHFRIRGLDGIRAFAVIAVLAYHLTPGAVVGGYIGVDIFFVVSGYIITALLLREEAANAKINLPAFWLRRARRLLPALVLLVLVCTAAAELVGGDVLVRLRSQVLGALTFSSNWVFIAEGSDYFTALTPELFRNLWSLAVEEQFYLIWPLALVAMAGLSLRKRASLALLVAELSLLIGAATYLFGSNAWVEDTTRVYYGTDTHAFGLLLGAALAFLTSGRTMGSGGRRGSLVAAAVSVLSLLGLTVLIFVLDEAIDWAVPLGLFVSSVLTVALIATMLVPNNPVARILDSAPLAWIGLRSYGLYLWHWPVFVLISAVGWRHEVTNGWTLGAVTLIVTLIAATVSYRWVETPVRRLGFRESFLRLGGAFTVKRTLPIAIGTAVASVLVAGLAVLGLQHSRAMSTAEEQIRAGEKYASSSNSVPPPTAPKPVPSPTDDLNRAGFVGPVTGNDMIVVGDSVVLGAASELQARYPGVFINAEVSRQFSSVLTSLQYIADQGALRPVVVVEAGTNGDFTPEALASIRQIIGPDRFLILVTPSAPRSWVQTSVDRMTAYCATDDLCEIAPWNEVAAQNPAVFGSDHVHFGPEGAALWVDTLATALAKV